VKFVTELDHKQAWTIRIK